MKYGGTNRQCTGVFGLANETITIYVYAQEKKLLPRIIFTQFHEKNTNWYSSSIQLNIGKNILKFNNFDTEDFEEKEISGGPIYIENPYTSTSQSQNIKLYIEGGKIFPLFRLNDDETEFKKILKNYILVYKKEQNNYLDIAEFYSDRAMITVKATLADEFYSSDNSPQKNLLNLDDILKKYYIFDGIQFEKNQPYYDIKNQYININFRYTQPLKGARAYASTEHIGLYYKADLFTILVTYSYGLESTIPHEIGHMIDLKDREYEERTNNVLRQYSLVAIEKKSLSNNDYDIVRENLLLDNIDPLLRGCTKIDKSKCEGFFNEYGDYKQSYLLYWNIECLYHGYWGKLDNLYRYNNSLIKGMNRNEALVFLTNVALEFDTGYYFERFGFTMWRGLFNTSNTSNEYKQKMKEFINQGRVDSSIQKKFWYIDNEEYEYMSNYGLSCHYSDNDNFNAYKVERYVKAGYYYLYLPIINCFGHLGYEIYENDNLIGFTYEHNYNDTKKYPNNYIPNYKIIAYDRLLKHSALSDKSFDHNYIINK